MAGFNRLALESNSIFGLLKDVHKIGRCHTNKKKLLQLLDKMELVNSENNKLLKNNILSILICKIQLLFQCKSLL